MTLWEFERKLWIKSALYGLGMSVWVYFLAYIINRLTGVVGSPLAFSIFALLIGGSTPLLMKAFSRPRKATTLEYEQADELFEEAGNQLILQTFGPETFKKLYIDDHNWIPSVAIDVCHDLLVKDQSTENPDLRLHLYAKLAKYYANDGQREHAIQALQEALRLEPVSLIANYRIAVLYESIGSGDDAIAHYRSAQDIPNLSENLKRFLETQIQRVKIKGPRQEGPYSDSGFQWIPG